MAGYKDTTVWDKDTKDFGYTGIQGYKDTRIQRYRDIEVLGYRGTGIQRYRDTEVQGYRGTGIQRYRDTEIQGRVQRYRDTGPGTEV